MEETLAHTQQTVSSLRALLERPVAPIIVEYRSVGTVTALAITEPVTMEGIEPWWEAAFSELHEAVRSSGARRVGPDGALYPTEFFEEDLGEVVAFVPVAAEPEPTGRARPVELPGAELAVTLHVGPFSELDQAYGALGTFVAQREIGVQGPIREHYLVGADDASDESQHRTEVCWPVFQTRESRES